MREESRHGAPRPSRAPGKAGQGREARPVGSRPTPRPGASQRAAATARLTKVIEPVLAAMEIDLEAVKVSSAGRRTVLRIVVDADGGISLDDIAEVSREVSARLDAKDAMGEEPYTLEVTSPGVDRPLTQPRHWRRSVGRLVIVSLNSKDDDKKRIATADPAEIKGRIINADQDSLTLEVDGARRSFGFGELGPGRVQVEFGRLDEIDDVDGRPDDYSDADDSWQGGDTADGSGPDEEGLDGH
jgi:ribosome maturation factor RimP